jgi:Flp pilus assembly protein TadG
LMGLVLVIGLSIDVSRIYMVRSGLQNAADAAALAAARELNSGTAGIAEAVTQANAIVNKYGFNRTGVTVPNVTISQVVFAASLNGPWLSASDASASGVVRTIKYVRVTTQTASVSILFAAQALGATHTEQCTATAGMSVPLNTICNFSPVGVALTTNPTASPSPFTLHFTDNIGGSSWSVPNGNYVIFQLPDINGNGNAETANLAAGVTSLCTTVGQSLTMSSSAQAMNGRQAIADGTNTRFDPTNYNGYGNTFDSSNYPPDTNVAENLTTTQYLSKSPLTAPTHFPPGQDDRRILVMPIIDPIPAPGGSTTVRIRGFGAFLLVNKVTIPRGCNAAHPCGGDLVVQYLGDNFDVGRGSYNPNNPPGSSGLTIPVLYR